MTENRSRLSVSILFAILVSIAVVAMVVDRRAVLDGGRAVPGWAGAVLDVAAPVEKMIAVPFDLIGDSWQRYVAIVDAEEENGSLRTRIAELEEENLQLREALVASGRLQRIAAMRERFETPMLPAELVGVDASPWFRSVLVDRGRHDGVHSGMPVISEHGLVGLVSATSRTAAKTMLLLDRQSSIDGVVQRSRARGIVRGTGTGRLHFEFVARDHDVRVGDVLITSGLGGVYPKGLRIGEISEVPDPGARLLGAAIVEPAVDYGRLEQVFVMLRRGPAMELLHAGEDREEASGPAS